MKTAVTIGSHNIMRGHHLKQITHQYKKQPPPQHKFDALCLQEASLAQARAVADALGPASFAVARHAAAPELAIVYNARRFALRSLRALALPRLPRVPLLQRTYTSDAPQQRHALIADFGAPLPLTLVCFHLDAAGSIAHRAGQMRALSSELRADARRPLVVCGDTNAFAWLVRDAEAGLARILRPLEQRHEAVDVARARVMSSTEPCPTHYFARAREPRWTHRLAVQVGRLGIDFPRRYDVVCSSAPVTDEGQVRRNWGQGHQPPGNALPDVFSPVRRVYSERLTCAPLNAGCDGRLGPRSRVGSDVIASALFRCSDLVRFSTGVCFVLNF